jgi:5-methylthioadenosine/S-adenosylhomocysteine deaminase
MRALVAGVFIDMGDEKKAMEQREAAIAQLEAIEGYGSRLQFAFGPHAIYTVGESALRWIAEMSEEKQLPIHIHLSETQFEVEASVEARGMRPVEYLDKLGILGPRTFVAHAVHLDDDEIQLLAERGVHPIHNPISNLKLSSGGPMRYARMREAGIEVLIGTDGCASNNNLDLFEELKFAALVAKHESMDPTTLPASEALDMATRFAARAYGLDCGRIEVGALADLILIDLDHPMLFPGHSLPADLVYGAAGRAVKTTVCDGVILMEDGRIEGEEEIRAEVRARLVRLGGVAVAKM